MEPALFSLPEAASPGVPPATAPSPAGHPPPWLLPQPRAVSSAPRGRGSRDWSRSAGSGQDSSRSNPIFPRRGALSPPGTCWPCGRRERRAPRGAIPVGPGHGPRGRLSAAAIEELPPGGKRKGWLSGLRPVTEKGVCECACECLPACLPACPGGGRGQSRGRREKGSPASWLLLARAFPVARTRAPVTVCLRCREWIRCPGRAGTRGQREALPGPDPRSMVPGEPRAEGGPRAVETERTVSGAAGPEEGGRRGRGGRAARQAAGPAALEEDLVAGSEWQLSRRRSPCGRENSRRSSGAVVLRAWSLSVSPPHPHRTRQAGLPPGATCLRSVSRNV